MSLVGPGVGDGTLYQPDACPAWINHPTTPLPACYGIPLEVFFPEHGFGAADAKRICAGCDAIEPCRTWALSRPLDELHGVWGGMSPDDRRNARSRPTGDHRDH